MIANLKLEEFNKLRVLDNKNNIHSYKKLIRDQLLKIKS